MTDHSNVYPAHRQFAIRALRYTLLLLIASNLLFLLMPVTALHYTVLPVGLFGLGFCYWLLSIGRLQLASQIFVFSCWTLLTVICVTQNGVRNIVFPLYTVVIIYAALLFSARAVLIFTLLSIGVGVILVVGEIGGVLPLNTVTMTLTDRFFIMIALFGCSGLLLGAAAQMIRVGVDRLRINDSTLQQRNAQLEAEIQERKRIENDLRASEERYRLLFEYTPVMATVFDREGKLLLLNSATAHVLKQSPEELVGQTLEMIFPAKVAAELQAVNLLAIETGSMQTREDLVEVKPGQESKYLLRQVIPLSHTVTDKKADKVLVLTTDLTEQRRAAQQEQALKLAEEKNAFFSEFFGTISHDLKTPITVMKTSLYLLERAKTREQELEKRTQLHEQVSLMEQYIQDMLMISRLEHLPSFHKEAVNINALVTEVIKMLRPRADTKKIDCRLLMQPNLPQVEADPDQLRRALVNMIENAITYTPPRGRVQIVTTSDDDHACLEIIDTGMGIAAEDLPHIFDRFYRSSQARDLDNTGTGLGLAIVKKIVDLHEGHITVTSNLGAGTAFRVELPLNGLNPFEAAGG